MASGHDSIDKLISQSESGASSNGAKSAPKAKMSSLNQHSSVEKKHQLGGLTGINQPITPNQPIIPGGGGNQPIMPNPNVNLPLGTGGTFKEGGEVKSKWFDMTPKERREMRKARRYQKKVDKEYRAEIKYYKDLEKNDPDEYYKLFDSFPKSSDLVSPDKIKDVGYKKGGKVDIFDEKGMYTKEGLFKKHGFDEGSGSIDTLHYESPLDKELKLTGTVKGKPATITHSRKKGSGNLSDKELKEIKERTSTKKTAAERLEEMKKKLKGY